MFVYLLMDIKSVGLIGLRIKWSCSNLVQDLDRLLSKYEQIILLFPVFHSKRGILSCFEKEHGTWNMEHGSTENSCKALIRSYTVLVHRDSIA
ncbi:hypothetical protein VNO78_23860 [Psophocarpus tetragonolobus]|uniref:Uncharacterized protein n=1 Tax=Psophocarpus tetragonolobus TaxID=3891 RepID=A0AAN9S3S4_PSOTE